MLSLGVSESIITYEMFFFSWATRDGEWRNLFSFGMCFSARATEEIISNSQGLLFFFKPESVEGVISNLTFYWPRSPDGAGTGAPQPDFTRFRVDF